MPWSIDGTDVVADDIQVGPQTVSLTFLADRDALSSWRAYDRAGDLDVTTGYAGSYRARDRGSDTSVTVDPPADDKPPLSTVDGYVAGYEEAQQAPDRVAITLTVQRSSNRSSVYGTVSQSGGDWTLDLDTGTLALAAGQVSPADQSGSPAAGEWELALRLSDTQAGALLDNVGYPDAVVERPVPDGDTFVVDANGRQTVTISAPSGAVLSDGDYYVRDWSLSARSFGDRRWLAELSLAE